MRVQFLFFTAILIFLFIFTGCEKQPATNTVENKTISSIAANSDGLTTIKAPETATTNAAPTLAPVVRNYYDALRKKDEPGAKKFLSQSALKYWQDEMKSEKANSLLPILEDDASPVEAPREVRNEKIEGDSAVAEIKGGSSAVWTPIKFVNENGEWKFASPKDSLALQDIKPTDSGKSH